MDNNEIIVTGKKYRVWNEENSQWKRMSFYTQAEDVAFTDGLDAETKVGAINGITSSLASTSKNYALSASAGKDLKAQIDDLCNNLDILSTALSNMTTTFNFTCTGVTTSNGVYIKDVNGNSLKNGRYKIDLLTSNAVASEVASSYIVNLANETLYKTTIHEGTHNASPRIEYNSTYGLYVLLANYSTPLNVIGTITKL